MSTKRSKAINTTVKGYTPSIVNSRNNLTQGTGGGVNNGVFGIGFSHTITYINRTGLPCTVVHRNNLKIVVPVADTYNISTNVSLDNSFIIRECMSFDTMIYTQIDKTLSAIMGGPLLTDELMLIKEELIGQIDKGYRNINFYIDHAVHVNSIRQFKGIYVTTRDLLISAMPPASAPDHPYNDVTLNTEGYDSISKKYTDETNGTNGFGLFMEIIDNEDHHGTKYFNLLGDVIHINPVKSETRGSGVYITIVTNDVNNNVKSVVIDLTEAKERMGLFDTITEAKNLGMNKVEDSIRLEKIKQDNLELSLNLKMISEDLQRKELELKALELKSKEQDLEVKEKNRELELLRMKYEERIMYNKQSVEEEKYYREKIMNRQKILIEILKSLPLIITSIIAINAILSKNNKN